MAKPYIKKAPNERVTERQTRGLPEAVTSMITGVVAEYEGKVSAEAMCARDADKLECLIQAVEYREHGNQNTQPWIDNSLAQLQTASAKLLAEEAQRTGSLDWFMRALNGDEDA
ncbi:HD domain-containing protein [Actinomadura sp. KC345]|uniref:HD domain-containing protein n=1 Tax=Actinomadura sp. KC345 TaxID=2530371 RepID=UPI0026C90441